LPPQSSFRPAEAAATEASLRSQLEQAQRALSNSESHVRILEHKADTAAKAAKQAALQAQREKAALQKQVRWKAADLAVSHARCSWLKQAPLQMSCCNTQCI
jgi:hypothetical protein